MPRSSSGSPGAASDANSSTTLQHAVRDVVGGPVVAPELAERREDELAAEHPAVELEGARAVPSKESTGESGHGGEDTSQRDIHDPSCQPRASPPMAANSGGHDEGGRHDHPHTSPTTRLASGPKTPRRDRARYRGADRAEHGEGSRRRAVGAAPDEPLARSRTREPTLPQAAEPSHHAVGIGVIDDEA
jgi:hypothetical protein